MKPERKKVELNENEKVVYNLLSDVKVILSEIKEKSALSNKAWDKSTKSLRKLGLISVEKKDDNNVQENLRFLIFIRCNKLIHHFFKKSILQQSFSCLLIKHD